MVIDVDRSPATYEAESEADGSQLFNEHEERDFEFATGDGAPDGDTVLHQLVKGWRQGGCDNVWSTVLPEVVALNLHLLRGRSVLELGAGCGLVGLVAAQASTTTRVVITDGDASKVRLCASNIAEYADGSPHGTNAMAAHLAWGPAAAQRAKETGSLGSPSAFDVILAAQVVFVPACIPALVETLSSLLAPTGEVWLYNEAVSVMSTQSACRTHLDDALVAHGFVVSEGVHAGLKLPAAFGKLPAWAYLLRLTRAPTPPASVVGAQQSADSTPPSTPLSLPDYNERLGYGTDQGRWLAQEVSGRASGGEGRPKRRGPTRRVFHEDTGHDAVHGGVDEPEKQQPPQRTTAPPAGWMLAGWIMLAFILLLLLATAAAWAAAYLVRARTGRDTRPVRRYAPTSSRSLKL